MLSFLSHHQRIANNWFIWEGREHLIEVGTDFLKNLFYRICLLMIHTEIPLAIMHSLINDCLIIYSLPGAASIQNMCVFLSSGSFSSHLPTQFRLSHMYEMLHAEIMCSSLPEKLSYRTENTIKNSIDQVSHFISNH